MAEAAKNAQKPDEANIYSEKAQEIKEQENKRDN